ncbi:hypothetical protein ONS96_014089 [Cadophora gregata f. sp. sojae]|nr:hypothetical protein ONS96_014089 [Cadophora gregata f. sp. sojae]
MAPSATNQHTYQAHDRPLIKPWSRPAPTTENLEWAPLLYDAVTKVGFWVVVNIGIDDARVLRQFSIGNTFFKEPLEEKRTVPYKFAEGEYFGYRENSRWVGHTGVKENIEMLIIPKAIPELANEPKHKIVKDHYDEIPSFYREVWEKGVRKLFVLISIILELPENYLVDAHAYDELSDDHLRYMIYNVRTQKEWDLAQAYSKGGHTDFGSLTLPFSQHVAGLQIRTPEGEWKYVKHVDGGITCNAADTLSFLTKGFVKSTIHRVVTPPSDQINIPRLGLLYFSRPGENIPMKAVPSPLLYPLGLLTAEDKDPNQPVVTSTEYVRARVKDVHHKTVIDKREGTSFEFKGLKVANHYD